MALGVLHLPASWLVLISEDHDRVCILMTHAEQVPIHETPEVAAEIPEIPVTDTEEISPGDRIRLTDSEVLILTAAGSLTELTLVLQQSLIRLIITARMSSVEVRGLLADYRLVVCSRRLVV